LYFLYLGAYVIAHQPGKCSEVVRQNPATGAEENVNKSELIDAIAERLAVGRKQAVEAVDAVFDTIQRSVTEGERVAISGFGVFERVERAARIGRNPATGEAVRVKATTVPKFRPGSEFKSVVSGARGGARRAVAKTASAAKKTAAAAKAPAKRAAGTRAGAAKTTARTTAKAPAKRAAAKTTRGTAAKAPAKRAAAARTTAAKTTAKAPARKTAAAKTTAKKTTAKKTAAKSTTRAAKSPAKKTTARKAPAKRR
jgi:DNA-binding protein HU-beta